MNLSIVKMDNDIAVCGNKMDFNQLLEKEMREQNQNMTIEIEEKEIKPLHERMKSKLWKVKKEAFVELNELLKREGSVEEEVVECLT